MSQLPALELVVFVIVALLYFAAAVTATSQIRTGSRQRQAIIAHLFALAAVGEAVILIFRAVAIRAVPLTGLFESMIVLTLVLGLLYLVFGMVIRQIWFSCAMSWLILLMMVLTALVAEPAVKPQPIATEPWVVAHALAMILGAAMILLAGVSAYLYLLGSRRLKQKQIAKVLGSVPNIQKLAHTNVWALKAAFISFTVGLVSGIVGVVVEAEVLGDNPIHWLIDSKIIGIVIVWIMLTAIMVLRQLRLIKGKRIAHATIALFIWIVFAFVGAHILCGTKHEFYPGDPCAPTASQETPK